MCALKFEHSFFNQQFFSIIKKNHMWKEVAFNAFSCRILNALQLKAVKWAWDGNRKMLFFCIIHQLISTRTKDKLSNAHKKWKKKK